MTYSIGEDGPKFDEEEFRKAFEELNEEEWEGRDWDDYEVFIELPEKTVSKPLKASYYNLEQETTNLHTHRLERELEKDFLIYRKGNYFSSTVEMASKYYPENKAQRDKEEFSAEHISILLIDKIENILNDWIDSEKLATDRIGRSSGRFPSTPWISVMDSRITDNTREGVYIFFFIDVRDKDFYMTIGQGASQLENENTRSEAKEILRRRREEIADEFDFSPFHVGEPDLNILDEGSQTQDELYPSATIAYKKWSLEELPKDIELKREFNNIKEKYQKWLYSWEDPTSFIKYNPKSKCYRFTGNPDHWITCIEKRAWGFNNEDISDLNEGDVIIFHSTGSTYTEDSELTSPSAGIIGVGIVERTGSKNENWWLGEHLDEESNWPKIVYFKKMFLTGDVGKLDLSRSTLNKYQENKEIINQEMQALLENSLPVRSKASKIRQDMHGKAFPWNGSKSRFKYKEGEGDYDREYPKRLIEEMMN